MSFCTPYLTAAILAFVGGPNVNDLHIVKSDQTHVLASSPMARIAVGCEVGPFSAFVEHTSSINTSADLGRNYVGIEWRLQ